MKERVQKEFKQIDHNLIIMKIKKLVKHHKI
jgi:hypothetical protein